MQHFSVITRCLNYIRMQFSKGPVSHITYFASLSCKTEERSNGLPVFPTSNILKITPNIKMFTWLNNDHGALWCLEALW
jgi:hypothetical protein